ncbi:MAG TPA: TIGR00725 family protein [Bacillota bacterium]|mgnify:CR=1 FL=1|nr:TIGR00725 family protein [Bacillota bacterium]HOB86254.1 TIGR00725 family protein [Bacillota bacterium]HOP68796.1 TIGR00725 family protein [Bacillota bacterium]HPT33837.1 TIGR00725 family protein [Bacillota bacterium]HPZ64811.1 TIGR00725 family protein [Bacillota bacterium]
MYYLAVVGASRCDRETAVLAEAVGAEIASRGGVLLCGGGGGVMEAASRGAKNAGGMVIGILPGEERRGNPFLTLALPTGLGEGRNAVLARAADALIAVGGEYGTLSEIALGLKMGKPVIGLHTWQIRPPRPLKEKVMEARTPEEAVEMAWKAISATKEKGN